VRDDATLVTSDRYARVKALDVSRSYIVQAPAGSGKTELLIQRYLRLLATVRNPEEVVAITFTRKAAGEMRLRVIEALARAAEGTAPDQEHEHVTFDAATRVLEVDRDLNWQLTSFPRRMRIQTLDALSAGIARSMPLSSTLGGISQTLADSEMQSMYRTAAAATFDWLATRNRLRRVVERVLAHLDNNAAAYVGHLVRMLETRDQWLDIVGGGSLRDENTAVVRQKLEGCLGDVIGMRLHRVRELVPAETRSTLMRLANHAARNLRRSDEDQPIATLAGVDELPRADAKFTDAWLGIAELLLTKDGLWRSRYDRSIGFDPKDKDEKLEIRNLVGALADLDELRSALHGIRLLPPQCYRDDQWDVLLALFRLLPLAVTELKRLFGERGVVDHIEVALAASMALGSAEDPGDMALLLDYQISHLLIDEMQDTSISQYHFLEKLVAGWADGDGRTLFCVGDPMQSIYRFRNAEVGQFLVARNEGIAGLGLTPLRLRQNFRSGENLVRWLNDTFRQTLPAKDDIATGAIAYTESVSVEDHAGQGKCCIHPVFGTEPECEAARGIDVLNACLDADESDTIAVLVRSRTVLPPLLAGLRAAGIEYQAIEIDRLTDLPEIIDVLALTRALCHPGDRIAWLALLRGPWVGLSWADLHRITVGDSQSTVWELLHAEDLYERLGDEATERVRGFTRTVAAHLDANGTRSLRERVELAWYALGGPAFLESPDAIENIYRFLSVVEKYETAGTLADVAKLETLLEDERVSSSAGSQRRLQIMTMHRAKGLQFDHVLLYGLGRTARKTGKSVLGWLSIPGHRGDGETIVSPIGPRSEIEHDRLHRYIDRAEADKDTLEQDRLLYVACTRAKKTLHLIGHVSVGEDGDACLPPRSDSLLHRIWPSIKTEFDRAFGAHPPSQKRQDRTNLVKPLLRRFASPWVLPDAPPLPAVDADAQRLEVSEDSMVEYDWVGSSARHAGTIVHRWLQMAGEGAIELDRDGLAALMPLSRNWAVRLGVPPAFLDEVCDRADSALRGILSDPKGRWSLYGEGHVELPVTGLWNGRLESVVIDRVRVDADGTHWIIDYKTSTHEGGNLERFLDEESRRYRPQLEKYAALYAALGNAPVRAALYFPLLQEFREVSLAAWL
jgi:ATP-dependent helicase/nuclease subunit A